MDAGGFVRVPNTLLDHADLTAHELLVYLVLLRYRDHKTGKCFPGLATIADTARLSRDTVIRAIKALEERGVIKVTRHHVVGSSNKPNEYTVALFSEKQPEWFAISAKGKRVPKRSHGSRSEQLPTEPDAHGSRSQPLGSRSEQLGVVAPSDPNKTYNNKNQEKAMRSTLPSGPPSSFEVPEEPRATPRQLDYLNDLYLNLTRRAPIERKRTGWERLSTTEASKLIATYWKQLPNGRGGGWEGITDQDPEWKYLTAAGRTWYLNGACPDITDFAA